MIEKITKLVKELQEKNEELQTEINGLSKANLSFLDELKKKVEWDKELLKEWYEEYWHIYSDKSSENEWYIAIPKFIPFSIGWLDHTTKGYNVFKINQYTQWLGDMPDFLRKELNLKEPEKIFVSDGNLIFAEGKEEEIKDKYGDLISSISKGTARVKLGKEFDLIAKIIDNGSLPFVPRQVDEKDIVPNPTNISFEGKYVFQQHAWNNFLKYGAIGIYWMTGAGKDIFSCYALSRIKVKKEDKILPNLYISPNLTILEQMKKEYFPKFAPELLKDIEEGRLILSTYQGYDKIKDLEFGLTIYGECHVLPADSFSRLATLKTKYRIGQSASPYREDQRTNLIFALTGFPTGMNWQELMKLLGKKYHDINVYIFDSLEQKIRFATNLVSKDTKTLLFVDKIEIGERLANILGVPFIHGATKNRIEIARESKVFVASRVMELGISIKDLQHIIEVDFLFGSKREEIQRTGRLIHSESQEAKKHDILMTKEEFELYGKRLHGLVEKGFKINLRPMVTGSFQIKKPEMIKGKSKSAITGKDYNQIVSDLFDEGFFRVPVTAEAVRERVARRGIAISSRISMNINNKLSSLVNSRKIAKFKQGGISVYQER
jgi:DNA excision repair protein ERCC-3